MNRSSPSPDVYVFNKDSLFEATRFGLDIHQASRIKYNSFINSYMYEYVRDIVFEEQ